MAGEEPLPSTVAVPFVGDCWTDHESMETLVSGSVAFNSLALQDATVSSVIILVSGPSPWEITGG